MSDHDHNAEDDGRLDAAEYVLGVLSAAQRREIEERLAHDAELAREVAFWEQRLGGLADRILPIEPPEAAWSRIEQTISTAAAPVATAATSHAGLWQNLGFWRGLAIGSAALAAASLAGLAYVGLGTTPQTSPLLATLAQTGGQPGFVAAVSADGKSLTILPASLLAQDQRSMELWLIPAGDKPHAIGLIAAGQPVRLDIPAELAKRLAVDATLAVSLEPLGGSPTGQPTGPVIASGKLTSL